MTLSSTVNLWTTTRNPLFQPDLFHCILDCLTAPEARLNQVREARRVFVALAQTCRALSEPSLDRLWSKLDSLEPLIRCFATVSNEERAKRPPSPTEWVIIRRYSHRIRELEIGSCDHDSLFFLQSTSLHPSLLVPNLRVLRWHPGMIPNSLLPLSIIFIQRLLSSSLVSLDVYLRGADDVTLHSFLANYPLLCSNLKSVAINITKREEASQMTVGYLSQAISLHDHLERLFVSAPINDVALTHIAMSPKLKELTLVLHPDKSNLHQVCLPSDTTPFRNVEVLSLEIWDLRFVTTLLRTQGQMFRSFELCYRSHPTIEVVSAFLIALASPQRTRSLRSVCLQPNWNDVRMRLQSTMDSCLSYDRLRPLTCLRHLHKLVIDFGHWFSIDDDDLVSLARNWPFLQILDFSWMQHRHGHPWRSVKYITFKGLLSLLACCPDIHRLCLPLDARAVPVTVNTRWEETICNPALAFLFFPDSPIGDPHLVEEILDRHFPSVTEVHTPFKRPSTAHDTEIELYASLWAQVNAHLQDLRGSDSDHDESGS